MLFENRQTFITVMKLLSVHFLGRVVDLKLSIETEQRRGKFRNRRRSSTSLWWNTSLISFPDGGCGN
jgi:hypothetical protein